MSKTPHAEPKTPANISDRKLKANRQNAQLSTGPISDEGKATSARNNFRHGFTGAFCLLSDESLENFNNLLNDLNEEHRPTTATESLLVNDMARHYWLYQRALLCQEECFATGLTDPDAERRLNLFLRYATTHERAFRRSLSDLLKLRKERLQLQCGFESQARNEAAERRREAEEQRLAQAEKERLEDRENDPVRLLDQMFRERHLNDDDDEDEQEVEAPAKCRGKRAA